MAVNLSITQPRDVVRALRALGKSALTFAGYGELGYEEPDRVVSLAEAILRQRDPARFIVNSGILLHAEMSPGIAEVLPLAKQLGFETCSIHPSSALCAGGVHRPSPHSDHVFVVEDAGWGVFEPASGEMSPVLAAMLAVTAEFIAIGGGRYTAYEIEACIRMAIPVQYHPARMNRAIADAWHAKVGIETFDDRGEGYFTWQRLQAELAG